MKQLAFCISHAGRGIPVATLQRFGIRILLTRSESRTTLSVNYPSFKRRRM